MRAAAIVGAVALGLVTPVAQAQGYPGNDGRTHTTAQVRAFLGHCAQEADARGPNVADGYAEARRASGGRACISSASIHGADLGSPVGLILWTTGAARLALLARLCSVRALF